MNANSLIDVRGKFVVPESLVWKARIENAVHFIYDRASWDQFHRDIIKLYGGNYEYNVQKAIENIQSLEIQGFQFEEPTYVRENESNF